MKQYNLLIVDDEQRFADMLARRLNLRGCNCEVSYSGREALNILKRKKKIAPHLIGPSPAGYLWYRGPGSNQKV